MTTNWAVRATLHPEDDSALNDVMAEAALAAYGAIFPGATAAHLMSGTATWGPMTSPVATFAVEDAGAIVGTISAFQVGPGMARIEGFYVRPSYQGRQVGRALWDRVLRVLKDGGYGDVDLFTLEANTQTRAIYEHFGCELDPTATGSMTVGPRSVAAVRYRVPLPP
jgi:ribosomal protein S18 acetylase RimI-like enzyme